MHECDNGRCISEQLKCSEYNPCGDSSDCPKRLTIGQIAGIVIGVTCFVGVVAFLYYTLPIICRRRRSANTDDDEGEERSDGRLRVDVGI